MNFRLTEGHRQWRKHKGNLQQKGHIEAFIAKVNGKTVTCIRLLKDFHHLPHKGRPGGGRPSAVAAADELDGEDGAGDAADGEGAAGGSSCSVPNLLVEVPLERQMLEVVAAAGPSGIPNNQVGGGVCG